VARSAAALALHPGDDPRDDLRDDLRDDPRARAEQLADLAGRVGPISLACEQVLPVLPAFQSLLPAGLQRGVALSVAGPGATSCALALAAGPVRRGSWAVAVGAPRLGLAAAHRLGLSLERLAVVASPPAEQWADVVGALVGAFDVLLLPAAAPLGGQALRRVGARLRERGSVLVRWGARPVGGADLRWAVTPVHPGPAWHGLGWGHGTLRARRVQVSVEGRRSGGRPRRAELWLPAPDGSVQPAEARAPPVPLHPRSPTQPTTRDPAPRPVRAG
jgi:hypothetical protein